jgi:hypothetical protein
MDFYTCQGECSQDFESLFITRDIYKLRRNFFSLAHAGFINIKVLYGMGFTACYTLRRAIAKIALDCDTLGLVEQRHTERAGEDAGLASNTFGLINNDLICFRIPVAGLRGADLGTERPVAILAGNGKVQSDIFPFGDFNPGAVGVTGAGMKDRTQHFALTAPGAFLRINNQYFICHRDSPLTGDLGSSGIVPASGYFR